MWKNAPGISDGVKKDEKSFLVMNALYNGVLDRGILYFGPSRAHIIVKK